VNLRPWTDWTSAQRPWSAVPPRLRIAFALALAIQFAVHAIAPAPQARAVDLPAPPALAAMQLAALGDRLPTTQVTTLYLQSFDNQPGVSIPFAELDYDRVVSWLAMLSDLDPDSQYPFLLASHVYASVPDRERQRRMLAFVHDRFDADPVRRWRWLAHAAIVARHRLDDLPLAIRYARVLTERATDPSVPGWARQMSVLLLADTGEIEAAKILLGGLLDAGAINDAQELQFLLQRMEGASRR
jgi:hypothetical protein